MTDVVKGELAISSGRCARASKFAQLVRAPPIATLVAVDQALILLHGMCMVYRVVAYVNAMVMIYYFVYAAGCLTYNLTCN